MAKPDGYVGFLSPYVWMFISSYEKLRHFFIDEKTIETLIQFEYSAFEEATVPICTFVLKNRHIEKKGRYISEQRRFKKIASYPIAYSTSGRVLQILDEEKPLENFAYPRKGLTTGDNDTFVRFWYEVDSAKFSMTSKGKKWFPMTKGGDFRRWYGNNEYCVNWENDGYEIKNFKDTNGKLRSRPQNVQFYFREGISWNDTTATGKIAFRYQPTGYISNASGPCVFADKNLKYLFGLLNSVVSQRMLEILAPNMKFEVGQMALVPIIMKPTQYINDFVEKMIHIAKTDWDSFETSWDFERHPLV